MTVYTLFGQSTSGVPGSVTADNANYTMGVQFATSSAGTLTGIWFYSAPSAVSLPNTIALYQDSGATLIHSETPTWGAGAGTGWVRASFSTPPSVAASTKYKACVFNNQGSNWYSHTPSYWTTGGPGASGITNGVLSAPNDSSSDTGQGGFIQDATLAYPNTSFSSANYWVDPEVTVSGGGGGGTPGGGTSGGLLMCIPI